MRSDDGLYRSLPVPREVIPFSPAEAARASQAKSTSSKSAASTATLPIWPRHRGSTAICCCTRWGKGLAAVAADSMEKSRQRRIRTRTVARHVPKRMAHAAAVGCCRFRSLSARRASSEPGGSHEAALRSASTIRESLRGSLRNPAGRAGCFPEHVASTGCCEWNRPEWCKPKSQIVRPLALRSETCSS